MTERTARGTGTGITLCPALAGMGLLAGMAVTGLSAPPPLVAQVNGAGENPVSAWVPPVLREHDFQLSIAHLSRGPEFLGQAPQDVAWTDDSRWIYFRWLPAGHEWDAERELWRVPAEGGEPELIQDPVEADSLSVLFAGGDLSRDRSLRVTTWRGDLFLVDRASLAVRRLSETRGTRTGPRFSDGDERVFYREGSQLFELTLATGAVRQITDLQPGTADDEEEPEGHRAFLAEQQEELFDFIRRQQAREAREEARREARDARSIRTVHLGSGRGTVGDLAVDPRGRFVAVGAVRSAEGGESTRIPRWITDDGYTAVDEVRTKVGDAVGSSAVGLHPVGSDSLSWLDVASAVQDRAEATGPRGIFLPDQHAGVREGEVEVQSVSFRGWNDAGTHGILFATSLDNKHRWILSVEAENARLTVLEHLADSAWVAGPCFTCVGWIPDSDRVWFVSEADRFAHLYTVNADGSDLRQLTSGAWEVHSVEIPEQRDHFLLRTNEGSPFEQHMWRMGLDGSDRTRLTSGTGRFEGWVSPDGARLAVVHSTQTRPEELYLMDNRPGADLARVTTSPTGDFLAFPWVRAEIIHFTARDGTEVPARIYRPADLGVEPNGAAILFVHGAGYLQNVHEWWSQYFREYMFHHYLAAQGFTVLDVDYRASAGYGRDWRTAIYRHMGGWDLWDYVDSVDWLVAEEGVDRDRIGIYGGSYGGFITLMALFTEPDVFHAGGAWRSVTDWAHYNEGYTSRILNRPHEDPEAYRQSSPIYFAENLRGHLLMGHPMYDTNVHFQDIVRLTQRLIELEKENWELAVYPTENHGMVEPTSWVDQLRRLYELYWRTLSAPGCTEGTGVCELPVFGGGS